MTRLAPLALVLLAAACSEVPDSGPAPIAWGSDACDHCRMIISEAPFAAQARLPGGKVEKFDDIGCLMRRLAAGAAPTEIWVADAGSGKWLEGRGAFYFQGKELKTPMASGLAAFATAADREAFARGREGKALTFEELRAAAK